MAMNSYKWKYKPHNQGYISLYIVIKPFKTVSWAITVRLTLFFSTPVCFRAALSSCHFTATARIDSRFHGPGDDNTFFSFQIRQIGLAESSQLVCSCHTIHLTCLQTRSHLRCGSLSGFTAGKPEISTLLSLGFCIAMPQGSGSKGRF